MSYITSAPRELFKLAQIAGVDIEKEIMQWHDPKSDRRIPEVHKQFYGGNVFVLSRYEGNSISYSIFSISGGKVLWDYSSIDGGGFSDYQEAHRYARIAGERSQLGLIKTQDDLSALGDLVCECCGKIDQRSRIVEITNKRGYTDRVHQVCLPYWLGIKKAA